MCERHDIGLTIHAGKELSDGRDRPDTPDMSDQPQIFIYDNYPGGIGFSEPLFTLHRQLLIQTRELVTGCRCETGCPACVGPVGLTGPKAKQVAMYLLDALIAEEPLVS